MDRWTKYIDDRGSFQLANYIYRTINDLMKNSLDMGTLLSDDPQKLRAYKEQTKKLFKNRWFEIADSLEHFGIIEKCQCSVSEKDYYCEICKGSRYKLAPYLDSDEIQEIAVFYNARESVEISEKLQKGLMKVLGDLS